MLKGFQRSGKLGKYMQFPQTVQKVREFFAVLESKEKTKSIMSIFVFFFAFPAVATECETDGSWQKF